MDTPVVLSIAIAAVGVVVTVASTLGGFAYHILDKKIAENKVDAKADTDSEERRRKEAMQIIAGTINSHYELLRQDIGEVKQDIKDLRISNA